MYLLILFVKFNHYSSFTIANTSKGSRDRMRPLSSMQATLPYSVILAGRLNVVMVNVCSDASAVRSMIWPTLPEDVTKLKLISREVHGPEDSQTSLCNTTFM